MTVMSREEFQDRFNRDRAELFEALGHPIRLEILQSLSNEPLSFSELKRKVKIESSGHLSFHLNKLRDLVTTNPEGNYQLTDEGKEALTAIRIIETFVKAKGSKPSWWKPLWIWVLFSCSALVAVGYFFLKTPWEKLMSGTVLILLLICISYYIRVRPSLTVNRGMYILLGVTPIGFLLWAAEFFVLSHFITTGSVVLPLALAITITPFLIGAFIGDWIGRRRNYRLPLSP